MCKRPTYLDAFPDVRKGIFHYIAKYWRYDEKDVTPNESLDEYMFAEYGERLQSPLLMTFATRETPGKWDNLAQILTLRHGMKWQRLFAAYTAKYSPVDNYDMTESESAMVDGVESETGETTKGIESTITREMSQDVTDTQTETQSGTDGVVEDVEGNDGTKFHGFNTVAEGKTRNSASGETHKSTSTTYGKQVSTSGATNTAISGTDGTVSAENATMSGEKATTSMTVRNLRRKGNIGVMTAAQMIKGEMDLWQNFAFWGIVVNDVANALTLGVFPQD